MGEVNLWKRANLEQVTPETRELVPDFEQPEYDAILEEIMAASTALNSLLGLIPAAQERVALAREAQLSFFHNQNTRGVV